MCYMSRIRRETRGASKPAAAQNTADKHSRVGVRELRQNLSIYLDRVRSGEVLTVTDHGHDVALLRPLPPSSDIVERMVAEGRVTRPTRQLTDLPSPLKLKVKMTASEMLAEMRREERS
jgi:prevent-host-death family protein